MNVDVLLDKLPEYQGRRKLLKARQYTTDIIRAILSLHPRMMSHYDEIAGEFWRGNTSATAEALYDFARRNLPYKEEKTLSQTVKTPAAILEERYDFGNDCKHYASFIVGVGEALRRKGYPVKCFYRFASYKKGKHTPGHVFAVFVDQGKEIWADPVPQIPGFNARSVQPAYKQDKMPPMSKNGSSIGSLYEISGVGESAYFQRHIPVPQEITLGGLQGEQTLGAGGWMYHGRPRQCAPRMQGQYPQSRVYHWRGQQQPDPVQHWMNGYTSDGEMGKAKKKHHRFKIRAPHIKIQPGKFFVKFAGAPSRNAFLLLVKLNTFHLAKKMWEKAAHDKNSANWHKLAHAWQKLGGKPDKLYKEIVRGVKTYNKLHKAKKNIAVSGLDEALALGNYENPDLIQGVDGDDESTPVAMPQYIGAAYYDDMPMHEIFTIVENNHANRLHSIGVVQAAPAAAIIAAAGPIIAALAGILKSFGVNTKKAADATADANAEMAERHNDKGDDQTDENGETKHPDGTTTKVTKNADGTTSMEVKPSGTSDKEQESADDDKDDDDHKHTKSKTKTKTVTTTTDDDGGSDDGGFKGFLAKTNEFVNSHKTGLMLTVGGGGALMISLSKSGKKMGAMQPILGIAGGISLVAGVMNMLKK